MPLDVIHPFAFEAALAAECAADQGRFEAYHDALFAAQDSIPGEQWTVLAASVGVSDLPRFSQCIVERRFDDRIRQDLEQARKFNLTGTPSVIIDETLLAGTPSLRVLDSLIQTRLTSK